MDELRKSVADDDIEKYYDDLAQEMDCFISFACFKYGRLC